MDEGRGELARNADRNWELLAPWTGATIRQLIIDGAGHWIQQERPREVNAALIEFLNANR